MASHTNEICNLRKFLKKHPLLSELIGKDEILFECYGDAPSPSKDYGQIQISIDKVNQIFFFFSI